MVNRSFVTVHKQYALVIVAGCFLLPSVQASEGKPPVMTRPVAPETTHKAEVLRKNGDHALQIGEFDEAARDYALASLSSPNDPILRFLTGVALTTIRKPDLAVSQFKVACHLTNDDLVASLLLQGALAQTGQADVARTIYLEAIRRYGKPSGGLTSSSSLERLKEALKTTPTSPILYLLLGDAYQVDENFPSADIAYQTAIRLAPSWAKPKVNLGLLRLAQNKPTAAVALFEAALVHDPDNTELLFFNADALRQSGNLNGAIAAYQKIQNRAATRKAPTLSAQALTGLGQSYAAGGRYEDAVNVLNKARVIAPTDPAPPAALGEIQTQKRDFDAAAQNYTDALRLTKASGLFGTQAVLYQALAQTQIAGKQLESALKTLDRALREEPESAGLWHRLRGEVLLSQGNQSNAEIAFKTSLDIQTDAGIFPQETLAIIATKGLLETITASYRADLSPTHAGFATATVTVNNTVSVFARTQETPSTPEQETHAFAALAAIAQYRNDTPEEIAHRETLTKRRSRGTDYFTLADAYERRARDPEKAKQAYRKALNLGGLSDVQIERARLRVQQLNSGKLFQP